MAPRKKASMKVHRIYAVRVITLRCYFTNKSRLIIPSFRPSTFIIAPVQSFFLFRSRTIPLDSKVCSSSQIQKIWFKGYDNTVYFKVSYKTNPLRRRETDKVLTISYQTRHRRFPPRELSLPPFADILRYTLRS